MASKLVIVESPAKAKTIGRILGKNYVIKASMGHVRDLPEDKLGIQVDNDFEPVYRPIKARKKVVDEIKESARNASAVYLATDPDREGEAISWHLIKAAGLDKGKIRLHRVTFHEITREAVESAFAKPRDIDMKLVDAQQARRILDRLVGYKLSPLLWKKVFKGLSAGRVQSAAVRLVVDREREIENFVPREYWSIEAELSKQVNDKLHFRAAFVGSVDGKKLDIRDKQACERILASLKQSNYRVLSIQRKDVFKQPAPPFITSTLQQEAYRKLRFTAKRTMLIAQQLYEGLSLGTEGDTGLITYMRTDSTQMAATAVTEIREFINNKYGKEFIPASPRIFHKKVKMAQEAHEAIRPTRALREPETIKEFLTSDQYKLYDLIWKRAVASQMSAAVYDTLTVKIEAASKEKKTAYLFQTGASATRFQGFMIMYVEGKDEENDEEENAKATKLPELKVGESLNLIELYPEQHFTQPPVRYTEAMLIKALEQKGIGRPSTYAPIISTIVDRGYVFKDSGKLKPEQIGMIVNDLLVNNFPNIVDFNFTAEMESELDEIATGKRKWVAVLKNFYGPFDEDLSKAHESLEKIIIKSDELCPTCGKPMVMKSSRFGKFLACSNYPECKGKKSLNTKPQAAAAEKQGEPATPLAEETLEPCPECGKNMVMRSSRFGKFLACSNYPACKGKRSLNMQAQPACAEKQGEPAAQLAEETPEPCPVCGKNMVMRSSRFGKFLSCQDYPKCKGKKSAAEPVGPCPECGAEMVMKWGRYGRFWACSKYPECKYIKKSSKSNDK